MALAGDPRVIVLDEWGSGVDARSRAALLPLLARIAGGGVHGSTADGALDGGIGSSMRVGGVGVDVHVRGRVRGRGVGLLLTSHHLEEVQALASHVALLQQVKYRWRCPGLRSVWVLVSRAPSLGPAVCTCCTMLDPHPRVVIMSTLQDVRS